MSTMWSSAAQALREREYRRERIATAILVTLGTDGMWTAYGREGRAAEAVRQADALIAELAKPPEDV